MKQDFIMRSPALLQAMEAVMDREIEQIPLEKHTFSSAFEQRMETLIRRQRKLRNRLANTRTQKTLLALAATFILAVVMVFSVSALWEPIVQFVVTTFEKFSSIVFYVDEESPPLTLESFYEPTWLPEGYALDTDQTIDTDFDRILFFTKESDVVLLDQGVLNTSINADTEDAVVEHLMVNAYPCFAYKKKGFLTLVWSNGQYAFSLMGTLAEDEMLRIAESVCEKESN
ncbi:MAG: DUF4367 domain-containing protein [Oscillospiraceae bacterium]|jgi:hypothetical protein|nr:DUF4367 domain-containing protein [Oscillospiraceae bacterium]